MPGSSCPLMSGTVNEKENVIKKSMFLNRFIQYQTRTTRVCVIWSVSVRS